MLTRAKDLLQGKVPLNSPTRSKDWSKTRNKHLLEHPFCEVCGGSKNLTVHHIKPYHKFPELELDPTNLITLCEAEKKGVNCHLLFGHLGNFKNVNPCVLEDCKSWKEKLVQDNT